MPGPLVRDWVPEWLKNKAPQERSVFDGTPSGLPPAVLEAIRILAGLTGANDPNMPFMGMAAPMMPKGQETSGAVIQAAKTLMKKFRGVSDLPSRLDQAVGTLPKKPFQPGQVLSVAKKAGVKDEELALRQIAEFIAAQKGKPTTPEALAAWMQAHPKPAVAVKTLGAGKVKSYEEWLDYNKVTPEARREMAGTLRNSYEAFKKSSTQMTDAAKFSRYQVPGGEHYKETLITTPEGKTADQIATEMGLGGWTARLTPEQQTEVLRRLDAQPRTPGNSFKSSHFDDPNILVHTRSNERTLPTGERGTFLEEVQSDWHQKGKAQGYRIPGLSPQDIEVRRVDNAAIPSDAYWETFDKRTGQLITRHPGDWSEERVIQESINIGPRGNDAAVPDAPFKETWPDLALKQHLLEAADNPETEWLGFTGGQTQAARYDLSKQVSAVHWYPERQTLEIIKQGERFPVELAKNVTADQLANYIGKDAAKNLQQAPVMGGAHVLTGLDLQVGGEGMHEFYDNVLPSRMNKLLKPFGGKVEQGSISSVKKTMDVDVPAFSVRDQDGFMRGVWENRADAEAYLANPPDFIDPTRSQIVPATTVRSGEAPGTDLAWIARLTPEMKQRIATEGWPLLFALLAAEQAKPHNLEGSR